MGLNIKNERVHQLAREAARRTGKSQTSVIEEALSRLLSDLEPEQQPSVVDRLDAVDGLLRDVDARLSNHDLARLSTDPLYDEHGLPT